MNKIVLVATLMLIGFQEQPVVTIVSPEAGPPAVAAEVLQKYIEKMTGVRPPIAREGASPHIVIRVKAGSARHDGFRLFRDGDDVVIEAADPRGCIHGAYALLEQLGCRFYGPEPLGIVIPQSKILRLPERLDILREPDFAHRFPSSGTPDEQLAWGFSHTDNARADAKRKDADRLGIIRFGFDHAWPALLEKQFFADGRPPEKADFTGKEAWLPADKEGKRRRTDKSICFSNPDALAWFAENAANHIMNRYGDAVYFSLWSADEWTIDLCRCEACAKSGNNDTDWYLVTQNAIRKKLNERGWKGILGWIVYHGSETVPQKVDLLDHGKGMDFMYAPRPRGGTWRGSFLSNDPVTTKYRENLKGWSDWLAKQKYEGTWTVFEYYYDQVLLWPVAPGRAFMVPRHDVMREDMKYYQERGFDGFFDCNPPSDVWWPDPLSRHLYHRLLWNVNLDLAAERKDFFERYYGPHAAPAQKIRETIERLMFEPPTAEIVTQLKDLDASFDAMTTEDAILAARIKGMRLWTRYCALCKESELHEKVTKDDAKGFANEEAIGQFLRGNKEFFVKNRLIAANDVDMLAGLLLGRSMTKFPRGKAVALKEKLGFDVDVSGEQENRPRYYAFDNEPKIPWDSSKGAPGWIEVKFREPREVKGIELVIVQTLDGRTRHEIIVESTEGKKTMHTFDGLTQSLEVLRYTPPAPLAGVKSIRILTTETPGNVAWGEIRVK